MRPVLLLVTAVLAAGCTAAVEGAPAPAPPAPLPPRPREVRLDGVDPCSLLTAEQRVALGLNSEPQLISSYVPLFRGEVATCTIRGPSPENQLLGISVVRTVGVERWQEADVAATVRPAVVDSFPAYVVKPTRYGDYCSVAVDVAPGQLLDVQFGAGSPQAPLPQDELCVRAERSADAVMTTLVSS